MQHPDAILETTLDGVTLWRRGKVRDVYDLGEYLLIVATDRLSAFDVVLPTPIPGKGRVLTQLSLFWFSLLRTMVPNHVRSSEVTTYPEPLRSQADQLTGRSMLCLKTDPLPVECVVRGYITGSGWKDYQKTGQVCGIELPKGLRQAEKLPQPIFTPATKAESGHDENIPYSMAEKLVGKDVAAKVRDVSIRLYKEAADYAATRGIIIADTKFEFGLDENKNLVLIDEVLTADSSRFWPADSYQVGMSPPSFDKQYVRDYLESLTWDKAPPAPKLPEDVIARTSQKYRDALERLTGRKL
jgi:phosphoribosylaminoimidazole-succinocarboxamide synthase